MRIETTFLHDKCPNYISDHYIGFRIVTPKKGDYYINKEYTYNTLVFMIEGEVEFSYDEYVGKRFKKGDIMFVPRASHMYSVALTDAVMLVLTYDMGAVNYASNCVLLQRTLDKQELNEIVYDFQPLKMTPEIMQFAELFCAYITKDYRCLYLHELKQKELFIVMEFAYTRQQRMELFYPVLGEDMPFRARVMKMAHEQPTIEEYARQLNMSPRSFRRKFEAEFQTTVYRWLLQRKKAQIQLKLSIPNTSVVDILREFKFADASHFYRFCREHLGATFTELKYRLSQKITG